MIVPGILIASLVEQRNWMEPVLPRFELVDHLLERVAHDPPASRSKEAGRRRFSAAVTCLFQFQSRPHCGGAFAALNLMQQRLSDIRPGDLRVEARIERSPPNEPSHSVPQ